MFCFVFRFRLYILREREKEGERDEEKHRCEREILIGCLLYGAPARTRPAYPGMCPDQVLNWQLITPNQATLIRAWRLVLCAAHSQGYVQTVIILLESKAHSTGNFVGVFFL